MVLLISALPLMLGVLIVVQSGMNRKIATTGGLLGAGLLNATVLWGAAAALVFLVRIQPSWFPSGWTPQINTQNLKYWYLLPGLLGLILILGGPYCIARWGATHTFVLLISAQLATSLVWDIQVEGHSVSKQRVMGVVITWIGALLASKMK